MSSVSTAVAEAGQIKDALSAIWQAAAEDGHHAPAATMPHNTADNTQPISSHSNNVRFDFRRPSGLSGAGGDDPDEHRPAHNIWSVQEQVEADALLDELFQVGNFPCALAEATRMAEVLAQLEQDGTPIPRTTAIAVAVPDDPELPPLIGLSGVWGRGGRNMIRDSLQEAAEAGSLAAQRFLAINNQEPWPCENCAEVHVLGQIIDRHPNVADPTRGYALYTFRGNALNAADPAAPDYREQVLAAIMPPCANCQQHVDRALGQTTPQGHITWFRPVASMPPNPALNPNPMPPR